MPTPSELDRFYRAHHRALAGRARRLCASQADADDLLQATFERSLRCFQSFRPGTNGERWLATIMSRLFVDGWRRQRRAPVAVSPSDLDRLAPGAPAEPDFPVSDQDLQRALDQLPAHQRRLLEGHFFERLTYAGLAARLGILPSTVGTRLHRSRKLLRAALQRVQTAS
jgi:RNA polymerase sigma-70 factor, ECF subfamily